MSRSVRQYTTAQFEAMRTLVDLVAERSDLLPAERERLGVFQADLTQTVREDCGGVPGIARRPVALGWPCMRAEAAAATRYTGTYPGRADQVHLLRRAVARHLAGCPAADDAVLIVSELASNAILHSASRGEFFTVRAELHPGFVWVEAEDLGGSWQRGQPDGRPHGLDVVEALTGPDGWGVETTSDGGRVVWARLDLAAGE